MVHMQSHFAFKEDGAVSMTAESNNGEAPEAAEDGWSLTRAARRRHLRRDPKLRDSGDAMTFRRVPVTASTEAELSPLPLDLPLKPSGKDDPSQECGTTHQSQSIKDPKFHRDLDYEELRDKWRIEAYAASYRCAGFEEREALMDSLLAEEISAKKAAAARELIYLKREQMQHDVDIDELKKKRVATRERLAVATVRAEEAEAEAAAAEAEVARLTADLAHVMKLEATRLKTAKQGETADGAVAQTQQKPPPLNGRPLTTVPAPLPPPSCSAHIEMLLRDLSKLNESEKIDRFKAALQRLGHHQFALQRLQQHFSFACRDLSAGQAGKSDAADAQPPAPRPPLPHRHHPRRGTSNSSHRGARGGAASGAAPRRGHPPHNNGNNSNAMLPSTRYTPQPLRGSRGTRKTRPSTGPHSERPWGPSSTYRHHGPVPSQKE